MRECALAVLDQNKKRWLAKHHAKPSQYRQSNPLAGESILRQYTQFLRESRKEKGMLLLSTLQQFDIQLTDFLTLLIAVGLLIFFAPAALTTPLVAVITESLTIKKHKAFYGKCARQMGQTSFGIGLLLVTILGVGSGIVLLQFHPDLLEPPLVWGPATILAVPLLALVLQSIYLGSFDKLKKAKPLHLLLGYLAAIVTLSILLFCFLFLGEILQQSIPSMPLWDAPYDSLVRLLGLFVASPQAWLVSAYLFFLGIAVGAGISQLWLIVRRHIVDYGRDYYNFAMHYCARLSLCFTLLATAVAGVLFWLLWQSIPSEFRQPQDLGILIVSFGLPVSCCILWLCILKSDTPLRHKPGAFFACLFLFVALCAQILFYLSTYPMI